MSTTREVTPADVVQFVESNTTPGSRWITGEEIVWVLSWYGERESGRVREALESAVRQGNLVSKGDRYATPELGLGRVKASGHAEVGQTRQ